MLCLVQQSGCFSEPVPLQGVPPLKLNINCWSPVNRNCFYNLAVHLPEGWRHRLALCLAGRKREMETQSESWQRQTEREEREGDGEGKPCELAKYQSAYQNNLAYLCLYSSLLLKSPTSSSATFSSSVHLRKGKKKQKNKKVNHPKQMISISAVSDLAYYI